MRNGSSSLADKLESRETIEQTCSDCRAFPVEHERIGGLSSRDECGEIRGTIMVDRYRVPAQFGEARQSTHGVKIIVEYYDVHGLNIAKVDRDRCPGINGVVAYNVLRIFVSSMERALA